MSGTGKGFLNLLFPLFAILGLGAVYYADEIAHPLSFLIPTALVCLYALLVAASVDRCRDASFAEHQIDSIYFLGFLYTLISLAVLFYEFNSAGLNDDTALLSSVYYVGISVTTSVGGVLFRNMSRGRYLRRFPEDEPDLEKSYTLLKEIAENFSTSYGETFSSIKLYLDERLRTAASVESKEKEYINALAAFNRAIEGFAAGLDESKRSLMDESRAFSRELAAQREPFQKLTASALDFSLSTGRIRQELEAWPLAAVSSELSRLNAETGELDTVIDSLIRIMEQKLERIAQ